MKTLLISDVHANLTALEAVLADAGSFDAAWCLGDLVGYGPDPNECVERVAALPNLQCVMGNHDAAALRRIEIDAFNPEAAQRWYGPSSSLSPTNAAFLNERPEMITVDQITLAHGSPRQPMWEYLLDTRTATANFDYFDTLYCFVGHTHLPVIYYLPDDQRMAHLIVPENTTQVALAPRAIINPGSVGQPRDRDPRAAYALLDMDDYTWEWHRVAYDITRVQERMRQAELPERHIVRLAAGW